MNQSPQSRQYSPVSNIPMSQAKQALEDKLRKVRQAELFNLEELSQIAQTLLKQLLKPTTKVVASITKNQAEYKPASPPSPPSVIIQSTYSKWQWSY